MKKLITGTLMALLLVSAAFRLAAQSSSEWTMVLNNDHSPFKVKALNSEFTFSFDHQKDTLTFFPGNKKPIKGGFTIEVMIKNNNKIVFTSTDKNLLPDKSGFVLPLNDVYQALQGMKVPSKPRYVISVKDKTVARATFLFEFSEK
ncbi:MAG TPA: hypothetical protein PKG48_06990 [Bacteroidales bacterium]|nr:hypothetical protein [Bacteroidales bacterium]HPS62690.1 hypothetical protein [Bacteroidales bacterium]